MSRHATITITDIPSTAAWKTLRRIPALPWQALMDYGEAVGLCRDGGAPDFGVLADWPVRVGGAGRGLGFDPAGSVALYRPSFAALHLLRRPWFTTPAEAETLLGYQAYVLAHGRDRATLQQLTDESTARRIVRDWLAGITVTPGELAAACAAALRGFPVTAVAAAEAPSDAAVGKIELQLIQQLVSLSGGDFDSWWWDAPAARALWVSRQAAEQNQTETDTPIGVKQAQARLWQAGRELRAAYGAAGAGRDEHFTNGEGI